MVLTRRSGSIQPDTPVCRICGTQIRARTGNTSNYLLSLKNKHSVVHKELRAQMESEKQSTKTGSQHRPTLFSVVSKTQPHDRNGRWWTELTDSITYWIAKDGLPLHVVEKSGFKKMRDVFDPKYEVPSGKDRHSSSSLPPMKGSVKKY